MTIYKNIPGSSNDDQATSHYASTKGISLLHNKCISKQVFNFAATQTGIENIHNLLFYPLLWGPQFFPQLQTFQQ